jgi:hypothetical protein
MHTATITFDADSPEEAVRVVKSWTLTPGAEVVVSSLVTEQIAFDSMVVLTVDPVTVPPEGTLSTELDDAVSVSHPDGLPISPLS